LKAPPQRKPRVALGHPDELEALWGGTRHPRLLLGWPSSHLRVTTGGGLKENPHLGWPGVVCSHPKAEVAAAHPYPPLGVAVATFFILFYFIFIFIIIFLIIILLFIKF
jgi:hypothetical protein